MVTQPYLCVCVCAHVHARVPALNNKTKKISGRILFEFKGGR